MSVPAFKQFPTGISMHRSRQNYNILSIESQEFDPGFSLQVHDFFIWINYWIASTNQIPLWKCKGKETNKAGAFRKAPAGFITYGC
jgi:hypothetical protein